MHKNLKWNTCVYVNMFESLFRQHFFCVFVSILAFYSLFFVFCDWIHVRLDSIWFDLNKRGCDCLKCVCANIAVVFVIFLYVLVFWYVCFALTYFFFFCFPNCSKSVSFDFCWLLLVFNTYFWFVFVWFSFCLVFWSIYIIFVRLFLLTHEWSKLLRWGCFLFILMVFFWWLFALIYFFCSYICFCLFCSILFLFFCYVAVLFGILWFVFVCVIKCLSKMFVWCTTTLVCVEHFAQY